MTSADGRPDRRIRRGARPSSDPGQARYAFLVLITGRDELSFPFNPLNFRLIDDQDFQYDALAGGGMEPTLEFGDLTMEQRVRGWLIGFPFAFSTSVGARTCAAIEPERRQEEPARR